MIKLLVGHKCDKERSKQVSTSEGQMVCVEIVDYRCSVLLKMFFIIQIADYYGMLFCEVSSKDNFNVDSSFYLIAQMVVELQENRTSQNLAVNNSTNLSLTFRYLCSVLFYNRLECYLCIGLSYSIL